MPYVMCDGKESGFEVVAGVRSHTVVRIEPVCDERTSGFISVQSGKSQGKVRYCSL